MFTHIYIYIYLYRHMTHIHRFIHLLMGCNAVGSPTDPTVPPCASDRRPSRRVTFAAHHLLLLGEAVQGSHLADEGLAQVPP